MTHDILVIIHSTPYGNSRAKEAIDYILTCSAYDQNIGVLFLGDGRYCLTPNQSSGSIAQKNISKQLSAFELYGIEHIYCENIDFTPSIECQPCDSATIKNLLNNSRYLVNF